MGNCIENFISNKIFGGINGTSKSKQSKKTENYNKPISFENNVTYGKDYINSLKEKEATVNSKWNQFKQRFGFGEELTKEEQRILEKNNIDERRKQMRKERSEKLGGDFAEDRPYNW